jgi:dTDP-4-dehydrorhamnose reductase
VHCCGGEHVDRIGLARRAVEVFDLDPELLDVVAPPDAALGAEPVPVDTRLDARATARVLGAELPALDAMLRRLRAQVESSWSLACPA